MLLDRTSTDSVRRGDCVLPDAIDPEAFEDRRGPLAKSIEGCRDAGELILGKDDPFGGRLRRSLPFAARGLAPFIIAPLAPRRRSPPIGDQIVGHSIEIGQCVVGDDGDVTNLEPQVLKDVFGIGSRTAARAQKTLQRWAMGDQDLLQTLGSHRAIISRLRECGNRRPQLRV